MSAGSVALGLQCGRALWDGGHGKAEMLTRSLEEAEKEKG